MKVETWNMKFKHETKCETDRGTRGRLPPLTLKMERKLTNLEGMWSMQFCCTFFKARTRQKIIKASKSETVEAASKLKVPCVPLHIQWRLGNVVYVNPCQPCLGILHKSWKCTKTLMMPKFEVNGNTGEKMPAKMTSFIPTLLLQSWRIFVSMQRGSVTVAVDFILHASKSF